ncbi:hypothetical protein GCM10027515_29830 [Schumannella luteola]|uniref:Uncharacterized protein n=1 Tax=Schumannella luteola TaxID=472059 RepID=A0A852Y8D7_9MICO|nr:hypothetical protein [Schumannella luteola]NYG99216.1 hypothetical protein [Schumannella luteola]TPX02525.1 hypothetical protein FJ656_21995 [Schumannella luteola]
MSVAELTRHAAGTPLAEAFVDDTAHTAADERPARWTAEPGVIAGVITGALALVAAVAGVWSLIS